MKQWERPRLCRVEMNERKKQIMESGMQMFPVLAFYNDLDVMHAQMVPWHWHPECELIYMEEGSAIISINQTTVELKQKEGLLINANCLHRVEKQEATCLSYSFVFNAQSLFGDENALISQRYVQPLLKDVNLPYIIFKTTSPWQQEALATLYEAFQIYEQGEFGYEWLLREQLSHLWYLIITHKQEQRMNIVPETLAFQRVKKMLTRIQQQYAQELSLHEIAQAANISEREALRCFQSVLQDSPIAYLVKYRLLQAATQLEEEKSISEIAVSCGFSDPGYFSKQFKRYFQQSPQAYRKMLQKKQRNS